MWKKVGCRLGRGRSARVLAFTPLAEGDAESHSFQNRAEELLQLAAESLHSSCTLPGCAVVLWCCCSRSRNGMVMLSRAGNLSLACQVRGDPPRLQPAHGQARSGCVKRPDDGESGSLSLLCSSLLSDLICSIRD